MAVEQVTAFALYVSACPSCGVTYAITKQHEEQLRKSKASFHCPNGHPMSFTESEADRLRRELERVKDEKARVERNLDVERTRVRGLKISKGKVESQLKRTVTRVNAGVCPHCNRTFKQLAQHMVSKHPDQAPPHAADGRPS